jgi:hypothetical protein
MKNHMKPYFYIINRANWSLHQKLTGAEEVVLSNSAFPRMGTEKNSHQTLTGLKYPTMWQEYYSNNDTIKTERNYVTQLCEMVLV